MKRILSLLVFIGAATTCAYSQIESGYYRIQNGSGRYISMVNRKIDQANYDAVKSGGGANVFAIRMKDQEEVISDPGSIVKITSVSSGLTLEAQDANTYNMTRLYLQVRSNAEGVTAPTGYYYLYGTQSGATRYLFDSGSGGTDSEVKDGAKKAYSYIYCAGFSGNYTKNSTLAHWQFVKIDDNGQYFGITPDLSFNGKYYTTLYCNIPFQTTGDMKVYYVTGAKAGESTARLNEITSGIVPAKTPVIIECSSKNPADNKVKVGVTTSVTYSTSLTGTYYSYVKMGASGATENTTSSMQELKNVESYVASSMRMLGVYDGQLALVKPSDSQLHVTDKGKYMPANKAYLRLPGAAENIILNDGTSGINSAAQKAQNTAVFNLQGQKVAEEGTPTDALPRGIYIINGKKVIKN